MAALPAPRDLLDRFVLLRAAEARARARSEADREAIATLAGAADLRASAAGLLTDPMYAPVALGILRDAAAHLVAALEAAHGPAPVGEGAAAFARLDALLAAGRVPALPEWLAPARKALAGPSAADAAATPEQVAEATALVKWLRGQVDPRTPAQIRAARWVRLASAAVVPLAVVAVLAAKVAAPPNVALHRPVRTSPLRGHSGPASQATDGKLEATHAFITNVTDDAFAIVDLGREAQVARVKIYPRGDSWFDETLPMAVELSQDGDHWTEIGRLSAVFTQSDPQTVRAPKTPARYVRVRVPGHKYLCLSEIEVYER